MTFLSADIFADVTDNHCNIQVFASSIPSDQDGAMSRYEIEVRRFMIISRRKKRRETLSIDTKPDGPSLLKLQASRRSVRSVNSDA